MSVGERRGMGEVGAGTGLQVGCGQGNVAAHHGESTVAAHEGSAERVKVEPALQTQRRARVELKATVSFSTTTTISERQRSAVYTTTRVKISEPGIACSVPLVAVAVTHKPILPPPISVDS